MHVAFLIDQLSKSAGFGVGCRGPLHSTSFNPCPDLTAAFIEKKATAAKSKSQLAARKRKISDLLASPSPRIAQRSQRPTQRTDARDEDENSNDTDELASDDTGPRPKKFAPLIPSKTGPSRPAALISGKPFSNRSSVRIQEPTIRKPSHVSSVRASAPNAPSTTQCTSKKPQNLAQIQIESTTQDEDEVESRRQNTLQTSSLPHKPHQNISQSLLRESQPGRLTPTAQDISRQYSKAERSAFNSPEKRTRRALICGLNVDQRDIIIRRAFMHIDSSQAYDRDRFNPCQLTGASLSLTMLSQKYQIHPSHPPHPPPQSLFSNRRGLGCQSAQRFSGPFRIKDQRQR